MAKPGRAGLSLTGEQAVDLACALGYWTEQEENTATDDGQAVRMEALHDRVMECARRAYRKDGIA